jgi:uncharacterized protein (UPF0303 family)
MADEHSATIAALEEEERELVLPRFDQSDAWRLGRRLVENALQSGHAVAIDIRRRGLILFRAALPGSTPDQEYWIAGKSAAVLRMEASSRLLDLRFAAFGLDATTGWLPAPEYAITGGSVPVRVVGVGVVAAVTVSGLSSEADHDFVVTNLRAHLHALAAS